MLNTLLSLRHRRPMDRRVRIGRVLPLMAITGWLRISGMRWVRISGTHTLAVIADLAADYGRDRGFTQHAVQRLLDARTEKDEQVWWITDETGVYGTGASAAVETTGLAVRALLRS